MSELTGVVLTTGVRVRCDIERRGIGMKVGRSGHVRRDESCLYRRLRMQDRGRVVLRSRDSKPEYLRWMQCRENSAVTGCDEVGGVTFWGVGRL